MVKYERYSKKTLVLLCKEKDKELLKGEKNFKRKSKLKKSLMIKRWLLKASIAGVKLGRPTVLSDKKKKAVSSCLDGGLTIRQTAFITNISTGTVQRFAKTISWLTNNEKKVTSIVNEYRRELRSFRREVSI